MYLKLSSWVVWVRTEKNATKSATLSAYGMWTSATTLNSQSSRMVKALAPSTSRGTTSVPMPADVFMWCQLVRQSTAAAADINDQIPLAKAQRAQQVVLEFADSFELTTDCFARLRLPSQSVVQVL